MVKATPIGALLTCIALLSACSSGADEQAAEKAFEACHKPTGKVDVLRRDGKAVLVEVKGANAKSSSDSDDAADNISGTGEFDSDDLGGLAVNVAVLLSVDCLVEATHYPGSSKQLKSGEHWDGWKYEEESGAGSEVTLSFVAQD